MTDIGLGPHEAGQAGALPPERLAARRSSRLARLRFPLFWGVPPMLWQLAFFAAPLGFLIMMTFWTVKNFRLSPDFSFANWNFILRAGFFSTAFVYTLELAALTAVLASLIAFPAAYTLTFKLGASTRRFLIFLLVVPFFTSYPVRIYSWQVFFSPPGIVNRLLGLIGIEPVMLLNTPFTTVVGYLTLVLPLVILIQTFALGNVDRRLIEAAHNLNCSRLRTILTVLVPSARVGLTIAAAFAFVLAFGDYISPLFLGGSKPPTLSILIADQVKSGNNWPRASVVAVIMIVTLMVVLLALLSFAYRRPGKRA